MMRCGGVGVVVEAVMLRLMRFAWPDSCAWCPKASSPLCDGAWQGCRAGQMMTRRKLGVRIDDVASSSQRAVGLRRHRTQLVVFLPRV